MPISELLKLSVTRKLLVIISLSLLTTLISCGDDCDDVICYNGGVCDDGDCNCPLDYSGSSCETRISPQANNNSSSASITQLELLDFPGLNQGMNWDDSSCNGIEPDIYLTIADNSGVIFTSTTIANCIDGTSYSYASGLPVSSNDAYSTFVIRLFDEDKTGNCNTDEAMAAIQGKLTNNLSELQSSKTFSNPQSEIEVRLQVSYN